MNTKLTLRLDKQLIESAKRHAQQTGISLSRLVAEYFALLDTENSSANPALTPRVRKLKGAVSQRNLNEEDYHRYLMEKHY